MTIRYSDAVLKPVSAGFGGSGGGGGGGQAVGSINTPGGASTSNSGALRIMRTGSANIGGSEFTIEMWIRPSANDADNGVTGEVTAGANYSGTDGNIFWDSDGFSTGRGWIFGLDGGRVYFSIVVNGGGGGNIRTIIDSTDIRDGAWHHVAFYHDNSSGTMEIYRDGNRVATGTQTGDCAYPGGGAATDDEHMFGKEKLDLGQGFDGDVSEIRMSSNRRYNGATYTVPASPFSDDANTVGLYHLDENTGTTAGDSSGSGSTGTLIGNPVPTWSTADPF